MPRRMRSSASATAEAPIPVGSLVVLRALGVDVRAASIEDAWNDFRSAINDTMPAADWVLDRARDVVSFDWGW